MAKIKGLNKLLKKFDRFGEEAKTVISQTVEGTAKELVIRARQNAPKDQGDLQQSIIDEPINKLNYRVVVNSPHGAFVEFGTGKKVSIPNELKDQAAKFRGGQGGTFEEGLKAIREWCIRKGIDEKAAYPIFVSILNNGIEPQPYLYPAYVRAKVEFVEDLKGDLKYLTNKYNG